MKKALWKRLERPAAVAVCLVLALLHVGANSQAVAQTAQAPEPPVNPPAVGEIVKDNLFDSRLVQFMGLVRSGRVVEARSFAERNRMPMTADGQILVSLHQRDPRPEGMLRREQSEAALDALFGASEQMIRSRVAALGGTVRGRVRNTTELTMPLGTLRGLRDIPGIVWIQPAVTPDLSVVSEGVSVTRADQLQASSLSYGPPGSPVRVGVLDGSFDGYQNLLGSELPASVTVQSFHQDGLQAGSTHGTAVAEIIHDMAPDAQLFFVNYRTALDHFFAVSWLIDQGVDVISNSTGFSNLIGPGDGRGPVNDDVRRALDAGIQWVNSAGNSAQHHWQGVFSDPDGDGWHNFSGSDETNTVFLNTGDVIFVSLDWDDWFQSDQDYDLYITDSFGNIISRSINPQTGSQPPTEAAGAVALGPATAHVWIRRFSATRNVKLQTFNPEQRQLQYRVPAGSLAIPADTDGAITVGATHWSTDTIEAFSSRGPTADGRPKPDISAPDGVTTIGLNPFFGTSASTPHVAGAIALMKGRFGIFTTDQIVDILMARAVPKGAQNTYGAGRLDVIGQ